jgi:hypothetical protein
MSTSLFSHRYYELIRTTADTRLVDSHSDQSLKNRSPKRWLATAPLRIAYAALGSYGVYGVDGGERGEILAGDPLACEPALLPSPAKGKRPPRRTEAGDMTSR